MFHTRQGMIIVNLTVGVFQYIVDDDRLLEIQQ